MSVQDAERRHLPQIKAAHALAADTEAQDLVDGLADALTDTEEVLPGWLTATSNPRT